MRPDDQSNFSGTSQWVEILIVSAIIIGFAAVGLGISLALTLL